MIKRILNSGHHENNKLLTWNKYFKIFAKKTYISGQVFPMNNEREILRENILLIFQWV